MIRLDGVCSTCGCRGIHACIGKPNLSKEPQNYRHHMGVNFDLDRMRKAVEGPTTYKPAGVNPREWLLRDDKCLVCGEHHNHGNLPCPTMKVT